MADEQNRLTEHRQEKQPDLSVEVSLLQIRIRRGDLDPKHVQLAACLGSPAAKFLSPGARQSKDPIKHIFALDATYDRIVGEIPRAIIQDIYETVKSRVSPIEQDDDHEMDVQAEQCYEIDGYVVDADFILDLQEFCRQPTNVIITLIADRSDAVDEKPNTKNRLMVHANSVLGNCAKWLQILHGLRTNPPNIRLVDAQKRTQFTYCSYIMAKHRISRTNANKIVRTHLLETVIKRLLS